MENLIEDRTCCNLRYIPEFDRNLSRMHSMIENRDGVSWHLVPEAHRKNISGISLELTRTNSIIEDKNSTCRMILPLYVFYIGNMLI